MRPFDDLSPPRFRPLHIVDGAPGQDLRLREAIEGGFWQIDFFSTAGAAIRHARQLKNSPRGEAWLVNSRLPEMSGADLVRMLRELCERAVLMIVGDQYDAREELAAYEAGAAKYVSKPVSFEFISEICASRPIAFEHFTGAVHARPP